MELREQDEEIPQVGNLVCLSRSSYLYWLSVFAYALYGL